MHYQNINLGGDGPFALVNWEDRCSVHIGGTTYNCEEGSDLALRVWNLQGLPREMETSHKVPKHKVTIVGTSRSDLNGREAVVTGCGKDSNGEIRVHVRLVIVTPSSETLAIRPENLLMGGNAFQTPEVDSLDGNVWVTFNGLKSKPELNGKPAVVKSFLDNGRIEVSEMKSQKLDFGRGLFTF